MGAWSCTALRCGQDGCNVARQDKKKDRAPLRKTSVGNNIVRVILELRRESLFGLIEGLKCNCLTETLSCHCEAVEASQTNILLIL